MNKRFAICIAILCQAAFGCEPGIGDACAYDIDCSATGDRICDNSQPGGYCIQVTCTPGDCPSEAACVEFITPSPEADTEAASLYAALEFYRSRTYCLERCTSNGDCRNRYMCADKAELADTLIARIIDPNSDKKGVCIPDTTQK